MVETTRPPISSFNASARKIYNPIGFAKAYNFVLWFIFAGALTGFVFARFMYLDVFGIFCPRPPVSYGANNSAPGECYYYRNFSVYKVGIILHLATILPASLLVVLQFTPVIRHKFILLHRISGYVILILYTVTFASALMIARHSFGGGFSTQAYIWVVGFAIFFALILAYINVKRLQIEQHRAWMLRAWFIAGTIITARFIMFITASVIGKYGYWATWPCAKINFTLDNDPSWLSRYPSCASYVDGTNPNAVSPVKASMNGDDAANAGAALDLTFGMALWLAFFFHAVGVEIYLHLTPKEAHRLRQYSYQRQLEAGMRKPGSAGITADRFGDAEPFVPETGRKEESLERDIVLAPKCS